MSAIKQLLDFNETAWLSVEPELTTTSEESTLPFYVICTQTYLRKKPCYSKACHRLGSYL